MKSHRFFPRTISAALALAGLGGVFHIHAAPTFNTDTTGTEGVTTDIFDVSRGVQVIFSTPQHNGAGNSDPRSAFGFSSGFVEPASALFADGPGPGTVDYIEWQTPDFINLNSFELRLRQDGPGSPARGASAFSLFASRDGVNFSLVSGGEIPGDAGGNFNFPPLISDTALSGITTGVRAFRLEVTRLTNQGVRFIELDATGTPGTQTTTYLDRLAFNAASNTLTGRGAAGMDDEGPGLIIAGSASPGIANDDPADAGGNNNGPIELNDYIFADGGIPDNGNGIFDAGETIDFLEWHTASPLNLAGFKFGVSGDGLDPNRDTKLVRFFVEGVQVDLFDNNGFDGDVTRLFAGGAVSGDDFRIEFTRTTAQGPRLFEVDAVLAVPEPSAFISLLFGAGVLALHNRRRSLRA